MSLGKTSVRLLSWVFRKLPLPGKYRIAMKLYPFDSKKSKGFITTIPYLNNGYDLKIKIFSKGLIEHKVLFTGEYESDTNIILKNFVRPGDTVIEAGANIGTETLLLSRLVDNDGAIYAFEPVPHVFALLKENCELNNLDNVRTETFAIGDEDKDITFFIANADLPNQGMGSKNLSHSELKVQINVKQVTLDSYMSGMQIGKLDFIKMDIQGAEIDLLKGAAKTIARYRPTIFLEAGEGLSSIEGLYSWFKNNEYKVRLINKDGKLKALKEDNLIPGNWLAIPIADE